MGEMSKLILAISGILVPFVLIAILLVTSDRASAQDADQDVNWYEGHSIVVPEHVRALGDGSWEVYWGGRWQKLNKNLVDQSKDQNFWVEYDPRDGVVYCLHVVLIG